MSSPVNVKCPACLNIDPGTGCRHVPQDSFECDVCGIYTTDLDLALEARSGACDTGHWQLTKVQRTVLSHRIRLRNNMEMNRRHQQLALTSASEGLHEDQASSGGGLRVTKELLDRLRSQARAPTPAEQAEHAIRFIGDHVSAQGESLRDIPDNFRASIGASDYGSGLWVVKQLQVKGLVDIGARTTKSRPKFDGSGHVVYNALMSTTLTLDGWREYEEARRGSFEGNYGFVALQFNDPELDELLATAKAAVLEGRLFTCRGGW